MINWLKSVEWKTWAPIIISLVSLIVTIILNIYNRKSIIKENKELLAQNSEIEKRNQRLKGYEEALSILEIPSFPFEDRLNHKKEQAYRQDLVDRINKVLNKNLLLLEKSEITKYRRKLNKGDFSFVEKLIEIAANKRKEIIEEKQKAVKK